MVLGNTARAPVSVLHPLTNPSAPAFRVLDLSRDTNLIETARTDAKSVLMADPALAGPRGAAVRRARDLFAPRIAELVAESD